MVERCMSSLSFAVLVAASMLSRAETADEPVLVVWEAQADLTPMADLAGDARALAAFERLQAVASAQREEAQRLAEAHGGRVLRHYTVLNASLMRLPEAARSALRGESGVAFVAAERSFRVSLPEPADSGDGSASALAVEASLSQIRVPEVWALGHEGEGVTVAGADTGVRWNHEALISQYRGNSGGSVSHAYHWHDAVHAAGSSCGADSPVPCDDHSHGSHTVGTMVGAGGVNQIGIAPQAKWIACRNMNAGDGSPATYLECMDWFLAPTDAAGQNPQPLLAPHVINNSWGCPPSEGCTTQQSALLEAAVNNLRAAGILFVAAAGNSGSSCGSITDPPAYFAGSLTVGNGRLDGTINGSSSRGPITIDGSGRMKPDLSAPGTTIRSALNSGGYGNMTGTSMAAPHVAGVAALVMSAYPQYRRNPEALEVLLTRAVVPMSLTQTCGGVAPTTYPNPVAGHGRIDALLAIQLAAEAAGPMFASGFEALPTR
jgi:serine protease AprX